MLKVRMLQVLCVVWLFLSAGTTAHTAGSASFADGTSGGATAVAFVEYCASPAGTPPADAPSSAQLGNCRRKLVVDIALNDSTLAGLTLDTDLTLTAALHEAMFPPGAFHADPSTPSTVASSSSSPTSSSGFAAATATAAATVRVTFPAIRLTFRRGPVQMRYPLTYLRVFSAALRDFVQPLRSALTCDDGVTRCPSYATWPDSSSTTNPRGGDSSERVVSPLGICCLCTSVPCALTPSLCNDSMRTHFCFRSAAAGSICVEEDSLQYAGWSVGVVTPYYALSTSVVSGMGAVAASAYQLTTDHPSAQDGSSMLRLLTTSVVSPGDADAEWLNVSRRVLFEPLSGARAGAGSAEWMLVPPSLVTVSGNACDKVGITPRYFYSLSSTSQCNAVNGTCLANQLEDLRAEDLARVAQGGGGRYLAAYVGTFAGQTRSGLDGIEQHFLLDAVQRTGGVTLRWTVSADAIPFTPLAVTGQLEPLLYTAAAATLSVAVTNTDSYAGVFYVAVRNCSLTRVLRCGTDDSTSRGSRSDHATPECVTPVLVRGDGGTAVTAFIMWTGATIVGKTARCSVLLRDAANATVDTKDLNWTVIATTTTTAPPLSKAAQCRTCALVDLHCVFRTVCEWQMLVWTAVALVATWCPYTLLAFWRGAWHLCLT